MYAVSHKKKKMAQCDDVINSVAVKAKVMDNVINPGDGEHDK